MFKIQMFKTKTKVTVHGYTKIHHKVHEEHGVLFLFFFFLCHSRAGGNQLFFLSFLGQV